VAQALLLNNHKMLILAGWLTLLTTFSTQGWCNNSALP